MTKTKETFGAERQVKVSARAYATAMLAQSTEETRYYLNGVLIEPNPAGGVNVVATNGHIIIAVHDKDGETNGRWVCPIPPQMRQFLLANFEPRPNPEDEDGFYLEEPAIGGTPDRREPAQITFVGEMASITAPEFAWKEKSPIEVVMAARAPAIDGPFPEWAKVVPRPAVDAPALDTYTIANRYASELARAVRIWSNGPHAGIRLRGVEKGGPVLAGPYDDDRVLMVLMPMRDDAPPMTVPAWVPAVQPAA